MSFENKLIENLVFGRSGLNSSVFEKLLIHTHAFHSWIIVLWGVSALNCSIFQKFDFSRFSIDRICLSTNRNCDKNFLVWICLTRLAFNQCSIDRNWEISVFKYLTKLFFMHHLCLGFTCIALIFYIYIAVSQSYLSLFSHITCIHFTKLGTQLDLKIDWLIFWAMYFLIYAIFMCELQKIFSPKRYDG